MVASGEGEVVQGGKAGGVYEKGGGGWAMRVEVGVVYGGLEELGVGCDDGEEQLKETTPSSSARCEALSSSSSSM